MEQSVFDTDYAEIFINREIFCAMLIWKRKPTFDEYKNTFLQLAELTKNEKRADNLIADVRNQGVVSPGRSASLLVRFHMDRDDYIRRIKHLDLTRTIHAKTPVRHFK